MSRSHSQLKTPPTSTLMTNPLSCMLEWSFPTRTSDELEAWEKIEKKGSFLSTFHIAFFTLNVENGIEKETSAQLRVNLSDKGALFALSFHEMIVLYVYVMLFYSSQVYIFSIISFSILSFFSTSSLIFPNTYKLCSERNINRKSFFFFLFSFRRFQI